MIFKYRLHDAWVRKVSNMEEFANGGTQVTVKLKDGKLILGVLISSCTYIIAARGHKDLPFKLDDIDDIFQSEEDKNPRERGGWFYWDNWKRRNDDERET